MADDAVERTWTDAAGQSHTAATGVVRIVSLVPSLTELLFALGLEDRIVGRTGFCIHPKGPVRRVSKVGGTKTVDLPKIRKLGPTHVVVNVDENPRGVFDELASFVPHVIVTHPIDPEDNIGLYRMFGGIFGRDARAEELVAAFEDELVLTRREMAKLPREAVLYLIWKSPWMTVARDTYISRLLALIGWDTVPERTLSRYPSVDLDAPAVRDVAHVLLSTEPYSFGERHFADLRTEMPTGMHPHLSLIDGSYTSWYGSRAIEGLRYLRQFRLLLSQKASH